MINIPRNKEKINRQTNVCLSKRRLKKNVFKCKSMNKEKTFYRFSSFSVSSGLFKWTDVYRFLSIEWRTKRKKRERFSLTRSINHRIDMRQWKQTIESSDETIFRHAVWTDEQRWSCFSISLVQSTRRKRTREREKSERFFFLPSDRKQLEFN